MKPEALCKDRYFTATDIRMDSEVHDELRRHLYVTDQYPKIVCLCGSTRFVKEFNQANLDLTLAGYIVLTVGSFTHSDEQLKITDEQKVKLDKLHKHKIALADAILVINADGYVGSSTKSEIDYARATGKPVAWLGRKIGEDWHVANIFKTMEELFRKEDV